MISMFTMSTAGELAVTLESSRMLVRTTPKFGRLSSSERAASWMRGRMLLIETSSKESYASTMRFYERSGYDEISRIKDFYRIEDDKVVYCKKLTPS